MQPEQQERKEFEDQPGGPEKKAGPRAMYNPEMESKCF
jgi:hypothetical protein